MTAAAALEIRVSSSTACNALAASIVAAYSEGREVSMSAIGPVPISTALKAVCVANRHLASRGVILSVLPGLVTRAIIDTRNDGKERDWVIMVMRLRNALVEAK